MNSFFKYSFCFAFLFATIIMFSSAKAQETVTSSNGNYFADARMAVPAVLKPYGYTCPVLERERGVRAEVSPDGREIKLTFADGITKSFSAMPNYNSWKRRSMACLRAKVEENGVPVSLALCAKLKRGTGRKPQDWRSKGVFMGKNGAGKRINIGDCR